MLKWFQPINAIQVVTLFLVPAFAITVYLGLHRIHDIQAHQNDALSSLICRAEHVVQKSPVTAQFTRKDKEKALRFYRSAQRSSHLKPCS